MTLKEELMQELEQVPEAELAKVIEFVRSLKTHAAQPDDNPVWQAYLASKREREEVYRRLANS
jgi:hypothetical protein